jgi:hypothetical protein
MNRKDLPERWKNKIKEYLKAAGSRYETLSASEIVTLPKSELTPDAVLKVYNARY